MVEASVVNERDITVSPFFEWLEAEKGLSMHDYYEDLSDAVKMSLQEEFEGCECAERIRTGVPEQICTLLGLL